MRGKRWIRQKGKSGIAENVPGNLIGKTRRSVSAGRFSVICV